VRPRLRVTGALAVLAVLACGCASGGGSSSTAPRTPSPDDQRRVDRMVLGNGSLPGYVVESDGAERLKAQLLPHGSANAAIANRTIRASWAASAHALLTSAADAGPPVFSDANLFRTAADAGRVWSLENGKQPGVTVDPLPVPPGAPPRVSYEELLNGAKVEFEIGWQQGPVIAFDVVGLAASPPPPARVRAQIGAALARAARAQQARITHALEVEGSV
jgi:hypothetical protein